MSRRDLSIEEKLTILNQYDSEMRNLSQREAAIRMKIPQSTLSKLLRKRKEIEACLLENGCTSRKRQRLGKDVEVEKALLVWFEQAMLMNVPLNRSILMEKARCFGRKLHHTDFIPTDGWFSRWKERHNIVYKKLHGEKEIYDITTADSYMARVYPKILEKYDENHIFNTDEAVLYYRAILEHSLIFKSALRAGEQKQKDRITVLLTCNMSGTVKKTPLIIGKRKDPRCFRGVKNLPVMYKNNKTAWMTSDIFSGFIREWDHELQIKKVKIALILDDSTAHPKLNTKNIEFFFLPANNTAITQPLEKGIIKTMKTFYRSEMRRKIIAEIDAGKGTSSEIVKKITILDAVHMLKYAWESVSSKCIITCFRRAGLPKNEAVPSEIIEEVLVSDGLTISEFENLVNVDEDVEKTNLVADDEIVKNMLTNEENENEDSEGDETAGVSLPPSQLEVVNSLNVLRSNLEQRGGSEEEFQLYYQLESATYRLINSSTKQSITDSFVEQTI